MTVVIDTNVFNKLWIKEEDSETAIAFVKSVVTAKRPMLAPNLLRLEMCAAALHFDTSFEVPLKFLRGYQRVGLEIVEPADDIWLTAEKIARHGHKKAGFPSLEDSLFHALAIHADGEFVTADRRHYEKAKSFGHITMLADWKA